MPKNVAEQRIDRRFAPTTAVASPVSGSGSGGSGGGMAVHELASSTGLGPFHSVSGLVASQVLKATGATTAEFEHLSHAELTGVTANQHHNQVHSLATAGGLGADHTISGATAGYVLRATSATDAAFQQLQHTDLGGVTANQHHNQAHVLATTTALGPDHTVSGLTLGQVLRAEGPTTAAFSSLGHGDLVNVTANQHHNQIHSITGSDHTITGSIRQIVGATATNTLGLLTPTSAPTAAAILEASSSGGLTLKNLTVQGNVDITSGGDLTVGANLLFVDASGFNVGINCAPDPQFDLDVLGNIRTQGYFVGKHAIQLPGATMILHYDGHTPFETNFYGETVGHMGQVGTATGGVIFRAGKFGKAVQIAHAATNLIPNPSFEDNFSTNYDTVGTVTLGYSDAAVFGARSRIIQTNAADEAYGYVCTAVTTAGTRYRFSTYVKGTGTIKLSLHDNVSGYQDSSNIVLTSSWQLVSHDAIFHASSTQREVWIRQSGAGTVDLRSDGWQLTAGEPLYPYLDGSMGNGHAWTGTAHQSTSTRTDATLNYVANGVVQTAAGSILLWMRRDFSSAYGSARYVLQIKTGGAEKIEFWQDTAGTWNCRAIKSDSSAFVYAVQTAAWTLTQQAWHQIVITWDLNNFSIYRDGALWGTVATLGGGGIPFNFATDKIHVGGDGNQFDGYLDDVVFADRMIEADEVRTIHESNAPLFAETSTFHFRATATGLVWADNEGLFMRDIDGTATLAVVGVDGKSWGGLTLDKGDALIGNNSSHYVRWDKSAGTVAIKGSIVIEAGSSGIGNISGVGALATQNDVSWTTQVTSRPTELTDGRVAAGLDASGRIHRIINGSGIDSGSITAGLNLTSTHMGYYNGSVWKVFIKYDGSFYFGGDVGATIAWDGVDLFGTNGTTVQWYARSTDGKLYAGAGDVILDSSGVSIKANTSFNNKNAVRWTASDGDTEAFIWTKIDASNTYLTLEATPSDSATNRDARIELNTTGRGTGVGRISLDTNGGFITLDGTTAITTDLRIGSSGAPSRKLHIQHSGTSGADDLLIESNAPDLAFLESDAAANNKVWDFVVNSEQLTARIVNDALSAATNWLTVDRTGTTVDSVNFPNGNVGIGMTGVAPQKFTVDGAARFRQSGNTRYRSDLNVASGAVEINAFDDTGGVYIPLKLSGLPVSLHANGDTTNALYLAANGNLGLRTSTAFGGGQGVFAIANRAVAPSSNPVGGGVLYASSGAGVWRGSSGTITAFGPAGPHCSQCGFDFWETCYENETWGAILKRCGWCGYEVREGPTSILHLLTPEQLEELI